MSRLQILENSLIKKKANLDKFFDELYAHQKLTNGQPMNDKRNGGAWFNRHEQLNRKIANQYKEIEKTEKAILKEEYKIENVEDSRKELPQPILDLIDNCTLIQWRKYPNTFFINGLDKIRLYYEKRVMKTKITENLYHKYIDEFRENCTQDEWKKFADVYNNLYPLIDKETKINKK